jgi:hypothetical protein
MNKTIKNQNENKKREAFKRFSKMGLTGLAAAASFSAFTNMTVKQTPAQNENRCEEKQQFSMPIERIDKPFVFDLEMFTYSDSDTTQYNDSTDYGNYNNQNYQNTYSNAAYSNNYSNTCD